LECRPLSAPWFPQNTLSRAVPAETDQAIELVVVEPIDGTIEAPLRISFMAARGKRVIDAWRPALFLEGAQDQMLIRCPLAEAFDQLTAPP
jgi:hypothetical protein